MNNCKLFETLDTANCTLDIDHNPTSYICDSKCKYFDKCFYSVDCPPKNPKLQNIISGWQKYARYDINDKDCTYKNNKVINILHLINPGKIDDIVIFRVAKKDKNSNAYNIRYVCKQGNKEQTCSNITEMNTFIDKKFQYIGRPITKEDFINEGK